MMFVKTYLREHGTPQTGQFSLIFPLEYNHNVLTWLNQSFFQIVICESLMIKIFNEIIFF